MDCFNKDVAAHLYGTPIIARNTFLHVPQPIEGTSRQQKSRTSVPYLGCSLSSRYSTPFATACHVIFASTCKDGDNELYASARNDDTSKQNEPYASTCIDDASDGGELYASTISDDDDDEKQSELYASTSMDDGAHLNESSESDSERPRNSLYGIQLIEKNTFLHIEKPRTEIPWQQRRKSDPCLGYSLSLRSSTAFASTHSDDTRQEESYAFSCSDAMEKARIECTCSGSEQGYEKEVVCQESYDTEGIFTVMIKNIPCNCKKAEVTNAIARLGFVGLHNFFYLPTRHGKTLGYGFIGFPNPALTEEFRKRMTGYRFPSKRSQKIIEIVPASIQGVKKARAHFKNTHVMQSPSKPSFPRPGASGCY